MGAQHSYGAATSLKADYGLVIFMFTALVVLFAVANIMERYHNYMYPHGVVYTCDGIDGVVLGLESGRKARGPYYLDGVEVDKATHHSCEPVEPPFNE